MNVVPTPPIAFVMGPEEAVKHVAKRLALWAAANKMPNYVERFENLRRLHDIDIFFGKPGIAVYHFVTHDDIEVEFRVDFSELTRELLDSEIERVKAGIDERRAARAPLVLAVAKG